MSQLQQLKLFVCERLTAAAEEIFGAVERTMIEFHRDVYKEETHTALLTPVKGLKQEEVETFTADPVCPEVSMPEAEASTQPSHSERRHMTETSGPGFPDPLQRWPSLNEGKLQCLLDDDAVACLKYRQSAESSSCCQVQTESGGGGELLSGPLTGWIKTEEEADGCEGSDFSRPLSSGSGDGDDDVEPSGNRKKQTNQTPFCCTLCGESFHHRSSLTVHVKLHANNTAILSPSNHAVSAGNGVEPVETHREGNLCYICGKTFSRRSHLKRHTLIHTGQKPHCCKTCGKRFARVECLRKHASIHTVERTFVGKDVCGKGFIKQRTNMVHHMRTHIGEKAHRCGICDRLFAYKKGVIRHMQVHANKT